MKKNIRVFCIIPILLLTVFVIISSCEEKEVVIPVERITLSEKTLSLVVGDEYQLTAEVSPFNATNKTIIWSSSNEDVVIVNDGMIEAVGKGRAKITATSSDVGIKAICEVEVMPKEIRVEKILLSETTLSLVVGDEYQLIAEVLPSNATNKDVTWFSNNEYVATVDGGKVKAIKNGSATITVTTRDGGKIATCKVDVKAKTPDEIRVESITLSDQSLTLNIGDEYQLNAKISPSNATNKEVKWFSSNESVATIKDGKIKAVNKGEATMTAITQDGGKTATCKVIVNATDNPDEIRVESITLSDQSLTLNVGEEYQLNAKISPSNATNKAVKWYSNNEYVATVTEGNIKAIKKGSTTITAVTQDGGKTATCKVNVESNEVRVEGITLSDYSLSLAVGEEYQITVSFSPSNATNKNIEWSSSNDNVATVTNGKIRGIREGNATITATAQDGGKYARCSVEIYQNESPEQFDFTPSGSKNGYSYVDLGLSVKWATLNIGANSMEDIGEYYAWGETTPYNKQFTYRNYGWKHCPCSPDAVLSSIYDAATELWGDSWRMPTADEQEELIKNCDWIWVEDFNGSSISGYAATSKKNGKSIFLPASKFISGTSSYTPKENDAIYWSASTHTIAGQYNFQAGSVAECLAFETTAGMVNPVKMDIWQMGSGATIRPVVGTPNDYYPDPDDVTHDEAETQRQGYSVSGVKGNYTYVDLGLPSRTLWATYNIGAELPTEYGDYFAWGETSPKDLYVDETYEFFNGFSEGKEPCTQLTKYVWDKNYGRPDGKSTLDHEDDAAYVNWGSDWCMPTYEQVMELGELCEFWRKDIVVNGKKIIGYVGESLLNGNRIYIPAAGWEYSTTPNSKLHLWYWTSDLSQRMDTWAIFMRYDDEEGIMTVTDGTSRWQGLPIRPVVRKK